MKQKPRFFCDNCEYEVGSDLKTCPHCGRFFTSVRCPVCSYSGPEKIFINGCPLCGYSASPGALKPAKISPPRTKKHSYAAEPPPALAYIITGIILLAAIALLSFIITR
jgi:RNA polymerase subunit RPABC4/transcription elongation factor Spt4